MPVEAKKKRKCAACEKEFLPTKITQVYCRHRCQNRAAQQRFVERQQKQGKTRRWQAKAKPTVKEHRAPEIKAHVPAPELRRNPVESRSTEGEIEQEMRRILEDPWGDEEIEKALKRDPWK